MEHTDKIQICKLVVQTIMASGHLTDEEHNFIFDLMEEYELTDAERNYITSTNLGETPSTIAKNITSFEAKNEMLVELALAIGSNGELSRAQQQIIHDVAVAMGENEEDINRLVQNALM